MIAEDEADIIRNIFDRYINTDDGINGVANYLNNHGYTKKLRQNGTISGFSTSFVKKIIHKSDLHGEDHIRAQKDRKEKWYP